MTKRETNDLAQAALDDAINDLESRPVHENKEWSDIRVGQLKEAKDEVRKSLFAYHKKPPLVTFMAKACHYAQDHIRCPDAWPQDQEWRMRKLECTSYQMACFLAQNTVLGHDGVEADVMLVTLAAELRSEEEWEDIIEEMVHDFFGGWK